MTDRSKTLPAQVAAATMALATVACAAGPGFGAMKKTVAAPAPSYTAVQAVLTQNCTRCHNAGRGAAGVDLSSYAGVMKGGTHGKIVVAGKPDASDLVLYINGSRQPRMPMRAAPLSEQDIALISNWVKAGAKG